MSLQVTIFSALFAFACIIALLGAFLSWQRRSIRVARDLFNLMILSAVWSVLLAFESSSLTKEMKIFWAQLEYIPASISPVLYLLFVLLYTGSDRLLSKRNITVLYANPALTILVALTESFHNLLCTGFAEIDPGTNLMEYQHGVWFWIGYFTFNYVLMVWATFVLFRFIFRQPKTFKTMGWVIMVGGFLPWTASLLYVTGLNPVPGLDLVPVSLTLSALIFVFAILYSRFLDLVPVARQALFESIQEGILVLDSENRILDINPSALRYLGIPSKYVVGHSISGIEVTETALLDEIFRIGGQGARTYSADRDSRILRLEVQTLPNQWKTRLIVMKDITELMHREAEVINGHARYESLSRLYRLMSDNMTDMLWAKDLEKKYIFANKAICDNLLIAADTDEPIGRTDLFFAEREREKHPERNDWHTFGELCRDSDDVVIRSGLAENFMEFGHVQGRLLYLDVRKAPIFNESGEMIGVVGSARDVSSQKAAEEEIQKRDKLLDAIARSVSILIQSNQLDESILKSLEVIGRATKVNRVYIFENEYVGGQSMPLMSQRFEWTDGTVAAQIDNQYLQRLPYEEVCPRWFRVLSAGDLIVGNVSDFPEKERIDLEAQDIKSILVAPVFINNSFWGFIGFDDCQRQREWSEIQKQILAAAANTIGAAYLRKINQADLQQAKERAEQSDRLKSAFLANMSHEIRTPMNGILGFTELLRDPDLSDFERDKYLAIIESSGNRLLGIINDIVDISKIEAGQVQVNSSKFYVREVLEFICQFFMPDARKKGLELRCDVNIKDEYLEMVTDREKIYAVLINLTRNAVKFTESGSISLGVRRHAGYCEFYVKDTGIGIAPDQINQVFKRFVQANHSDKPVPRGGAGLGLSISKAYVELLGGRIWVDSSPGKGSTFYFTIPCLGGDDSRGSM